MYPHSVFCAFHSPRQPAVEVTPKLWSGKNFCFSHALRVLSPSPLPQKGLNPGVQQRYPSESVWRVIVRDECLSLCGGVEEKSVNCIFCPLLASVTLSCSKLRRWFSRTCLLQFVLNVSLWRVFFSPFFWSRMRQGLDCLPECGVLEAG